MNGALTKHGASLNLGLLVVSAQTGRPLHSIQSQCAVSWVNFSHQILLLKAHRLLHYMHTPCEKTDINVTFNANLLYVNMITLLSFVNFQTQTFFYCFSQAKQQRLFEDYASINETLDVARGLISETDLIVADMDALVQVRRVMFRLISVSPRLTPSFKIKNIFLSLSLVTVDLMR